MGKVIYHFRGPFLAVSVDVDDNHPIIYHSSNLSWFVLGNHAAWAQEGPISRESEWRDFRVLNQVFNLGFRVPF